MSIGFRTENNIGIIEFDHPDSKVNILTAEVLARFNDLLAEIEKMPQLRAVVIVSLKKDIFIAGADIKEIEGITDPKEGEAKARAGQNIFNRLEDLKIPTVAVINGVALGGGCELALACRYRVATFNEKIRIGLPEVNLGIVPGFGGTYRMPKVVGLAKGLRMVSGGVLVSSKDALRIGLVNRLMPQRNLREQLFRFIDEVRKRENPAPARSSAKGMIKLLESNVLGQIVLFGMARKSVLKVTRGFYPAASKAIDVIQKTHSLPRETAMTIEAEEFGKLAVTDISKNLIKVFYLSEKYKKLLPPGAEKIVPKPIEKCGVVGAGIMGGGIAQILSYNGISARLKDISYDAIGKGFKAASKIFDQAVKRRKLSAAEAQAKMLMISGTLDYSGFQNLDMVIEAVVENVEVKKKVFKELSENSSPEAILCSNTSALSVTEMAQQAKDPSKVVGLHFFNPVHRMPLVEVVRAKQTSLETLVTTISLARRLGKTPIVVKDSSGFLVNRILLSYLNEAGRIMEETGELQTIDKAIANFGMPMGPFALSDEVGLDVGLKVLHILEQAFGERFKPVNTFEKILQRGFLGKKTGKGFYLYGSKIVPNPAVLPLIKEAGPNRKFDAAEAVDRVMLVMVNEAARCLEEGVVDEPGAVDIGMIMGTGFPAFRGGLLRYADTVGTARIAEILARFETQFNSERFKPCACLADLARRDAKFYS